MSASYSMYLEISTLGILLKPTSIIYRSNFNKIRERHLTVLVHESPLASHTNIISAKTIGTTYDGT